MAEIQTASVCFSKSKSEITLFFFHVDTEMTDFFGRFVFYLYLFRKRRKFSYLKVKSVALQSSARKKLK